MNIRNILIGIAAAAALAFAVPAAEAQTTLLNQIPAPAPTASAAGKGSLFTQYQTVPGGALYQSILSPVGGGPQSMASSFVPGGGGAVTRYFALTNGKTDPGVPMTATATGGAFGVSRTAGTSLVLAGEVTSSNAKTDKVLWEFNLPDTYVAGTNVPVVINANYTGSGTITGGSTSLTVTAYTETNGVEAALTVSSAQLFTGTATDYTFTITGTGLTPGRHLVVEVAMLVTTSSGANTGQLNSASYGS